jgi:hypothetical protein
MPPIGEIAVTVTDGGVELGVAQVETRAADQRDGIGAPAAHPNAAAGHVRSPT